MANFGEIKAYWTQKSVAGTKDFNDAYWLFSWTQSTIGPGNSEIKWTLKAMQDSGSNGLASRCDIYINNELIFDCEDKYYTFSSGGTLVKSGEFQYQHDVNGKASFEVRLEGRIYVLNSNELSQTFELDDNFPYAPCTSPTIVKLSPLFPKPGGPFEFSWSNAIAGTANPIRAYKLSYALIDSDGKTQYTAEEEITSSLTYGSWNQTLPSNDEYRGYTVQISIQVLGTIENYNSEEKTANLGIVNTKPVLAVNSSQDIIPSIGDTTINFSLGATDNDGQELTFYYSIGSTEKTACSSNPRFTINEEKTFTFYAYDGVEYSDGVSKTIQKNSAPTCEIEIEGDKYIDQNIKCTITGGQDNNEFSYYLKYGTSSYLLTTTSNQSYFIGDIRALLGSKLNGLSPNGGYNCSFFVIREDGIEQAESNEVRNDFNTPFLSFSDDLGTIIDKKTPYFSKKINITINGHGINVNTIGLKDTDKVANVEGSTVQLDTSKVDYSTSFSTLWVNDSFDLNLSFNLIKTSEIVLQPTAGNDTPFGKKDFKFNGYTDNILNFYFNILDNPEYGFSDKEELVIKSGGYSSTANYNESSSGESGAREYTINGREFYSAFLEKRTQLPASLDITYELKNKYGDTFSGSSTLNLIYSAPAKQVDNPYLQVEGTGLENWAYLKEGMPIYTGLEIYSIIKPTVSFLCQKGENWQILSSPTLVESEEKFSIEGYNTEVYKYTILEPIYTLGAINEDFSTAFKVKITTGSDTVEKEFLKHSNEKLSCEVRGHCAPTIKIGAASLSDGKLTTEFSVEDWGLTNNDEDKKIKLNLRDKNGNISEKGLVTYASKITWDLTEDENKNEFLYIAPILTTTLGTYKLGDSSTRYFETTKTNEPPSVFYFLVYNIVPTIAYRQNCIGLNTNNPQYMPSSDEDNKKAILDIHSYGENKIIQLLHTSGGTTTTATINLEDFSLREFTIDCGSW